MIDRNDPLWNPGAPGDHDLDQIQRALAPYGARARGLSMPAISRRRPWQRRALPWTMVAGLMLLLLGASYQYRLAWAPGSSWTVILHEPSAETEEMQLGPGQTLDTSVKESATVEVARIGRISLSSDSSLRLIETAAGRHRVALDYGHLRARIWAPPGYFGVHAADAEVVDLGCDFDLWKGRDGTGRVSVRSGWVSFRVGNEDVLLPQGYALSFAEGTASTPLRVDAPTALVGAVQALETMLKSGDFRSLKLDEAAQGVAETARKQDAFTLLSLLTRWPALARTELYPQLATALDVQEIAPGHRQAWEAANQKAIDAWWKKLPRQPKQWWANWTDML